MLFDSNFIAAEYDCNEVAFLGLIIGTVGDQSKFTVGNLRSENVGGETSVHAVLSATKYPNIFTAGRDIKKILHAFLAPARVIAMVEIETERDGVTLFDERD